MNAKNQPAQPPKTEGPWTLGEPDGGWVDIDYRDHGGYAKAVWRMDDDERSPDCEALARSMVASLNAIATAIPVAEVCSSNSDSAEFGERSLRPLVDIDSFEYGTVLYAIPGHATTSGAADQPCKSPRDPVGRASQEETTEAHAEAEKAVAPPPLVEQHSQTEPTDEIDFTSPGDEPSSVERTTVSRRIEELVEQYGSIKEVANRLGVNATYLHRLASGGKTSPSEDVLKKLGLRRIVSYERCV